MVEAEGGDEGADLDGVDGVDGEGEGGTVDRRRTAVDPSAPPGQMGRPAGPIHLEVVEAEDIDGGAG